jgi:hypothetical protein
MKLQERKIVGIYKITNPKGRIYIGQSVDCVRREYTYKRIDCKRQPRLYLSLKKHGWGKHKFEIIEECPIEYLTELEVWWKLFYGIICVENGLSCNYFDTGGGYHSEETKRRMSLSYQNKSKEEKLLIAMKRSKALKGKLKSEETKLKFKGRKNSVEHTEAIILIKRGQIYSQEQRNKISKAKKGKKQNKEWLLNRLTPFNLEKQRISVIKPIIQYSKKNKLIKEWDCIKDANLFLIGREKHSSISNCLKGLCKTAHGFIWKYK